MFPAGVPQRPSLELELPLFPGYVFVRLGQEGRLPVLQIPGIVRFVSSNGRPIAVEDGEIDWLRKGIVNGVHAEPHPYLKVGQRVRVKPGPLAGAEGVLVRKKDTFRLVISLDLLMRSVAAEVRAADLE